MKSRALLFGLLGALMIAGAFRRELQVAAIIAGLIERRHPGKEKTGRQITVSSDIIYDVLYEHEPDHILIQATRRDAARGAFDTFGADDLGHQAAILSRAAFLTLVTARSRLRRDRWSMKSTPLRWSISCWMQTA